MDIQEKDNNLIVWHFRSSNSTQNSQLPLPQSQKANEREPVQVVMTMRERVLAKSSVFPLESGNNDICNNKFTWNIKQNQRWLKSPPTQRHQRFSRQQTKLTTGKVATKR